MLLLLCPAAMPLCKHVRDACTQGTVLLLEARVPRVVSPPHPPHRAHTTAMSTHTLTQPLHTTLLRGRRPLRGPGPATCCAWLRCGGSPLCPVLLAAAAAAAAELLLWGCAIQALGRCSTMKSERPLGNASCGAAQKLFWGARNPSSSKAQLQENLSGPGLQARQTNSFCTTRMWRRWRSTVATHAMEAQC